VYVEKEREAIRNPEIISVEDLVPQNHLVRKLERAIDWSFIRDEVKDLYSPLEWGRPGIDPVVLFKLVMLQYTFGIRSMRQTLAETEVNMAYRWFIGYGMTEKIPHFSTFSKNYTRRFKDSDIFEKIFIHILEEAVMSGYVDARNIFIDGTHIKANANKNKKVKVQLTASAKAYQEQLEQEIALDREAHGKKPLKDRNNSDDDSHNGGAANSESAEDSETPTNGQKTVTQSTTDPDCGMFVKGEHERQFAYVANTACDRHNFILGFHLGAGNLHDSQTFHYVYDDVIKRFPEVEAVAIDAGYKTPGIMKQIIDSNRIPCVPYKKPLTREGFFHKNEYIYDEQYDCYLCPQNQTLKYSTTNRDGYREYKSDPEICKDCPCRTQCTLSGDMKKTVTRHVWADYSEKAEEYRQTYEYQDIYRNRKKTIERVFADAKEKHGLRFTQLRGIAKVRMQVMLTFACMNLKKLAQWRYWTLGVNPI
jgi:transposase